MSYCHLCSEPNVPSKVVPVYRWLYCCYLHVLRIHSATFINTSTAVSIFKTIYHVNVCTIEVGLSSVWRSPCCTHKFFRPGLSHPYDIASKLACDVLISISVRQNNKLTMFLVMLYLSELLEATYLHWRSMTWTPYS